MKSIVPCLARIWRRINPLAQLRAEMEALRRECKLAVPVSPDVILTRFGEFVLSLPAADHGMVASYVFGDNIELGFRLLFGKWVGEGMTVIDAGAHIGIYTLLASSRVGPNGRVFSFEPTPSTFALLQENVARTAYRDRVVLYQKAVSDKAGRLPFAVSKGVSRNNSLFFDTRAAGPEIIEVETVTLDQAIPTGQRIHVVKIDVEGAEPSVIRGMSRILESNPDILLFMEYAPEHIRRAGESPEAFLRLLAGLGFRFHVIRDFEGACDEIGLEDLLGRPSANLLLRRPPFRGPRP